MRAGIGESRCGTLGGVVFLIAVTATASLAQNKPPASVVPEPYRQKFVQYVDRRSIQEKALNLISLTSQDVGRSFALIAGVSKYPNMPKLDWELPAAAADVEMLRDYLQNQELFDEIVVLKDGDVNSDNLEYFLQNYFPDRLRKFPKSRFLFAYSGHGMVEGPRENPTGYLLKNTARSLSDKLNSINMSVLRVYIDQVIDAGYQTLVLINACHSGAFLSRRPFGGTSNASAGGIYLPKYGGAHAIMAGGTNQLSWHDPKLGRGSVFFEKLLAGLGGQADTFPIYPDGHRGDGVVTVDEIATYLREEVSFATNQDQIPIPSDLALNRSLGGFFFLNRQKMVSSGIVPEWTPKRATAFGIKAEEALLSAKGYWDKQQYDRALPLLLSASEGGNAEAASYLGFMYESGWAVPKDDTQAVSWYRKAAEGGDTYGMANLGVMYRDGRGVPQDDVQAVSWFRRAAEAGHAGGMANLGYMYDSGRGGLKKDDVQAASLYRKAAEAGDAHGMANLGVMYRDGMGGLPKDEAQAVSWFRKAAEAGDTDGMVKLGVMYRDGRGVPQDDVQAVSWFRKAAETSHAGGMANLGYMYDSGRGGLPQDDAWAVSWYHKAAEAGDAHGMSNLGVMYRDGRGVQHNDIQAVSWFRKAAEAGDPDGMVKLGAMYGEGRGGLPKDEVEAVSLYRKSAEGGNARGMANLGYMYEKGLGGLPKDEALAVGWYRKAAALGDTYAREALTRLGR